MQILSLSFFGLLGILSRYGIDRALSISPENFPFGTFAINIAGCALAGVIFVLSEQNLITPGLQLALIAGFCGGFTTFSAYGLQTLQLIEKGRFAPALSYYLLSPALGLAAAFIAVTLTRRFAV